MPLVDAGINIFNAATRRHCEPTFRSDGDVGVAGWVKRLKGMPTIVVGSVGMAATRGP